MNFGPMKCFHSYLYVGNSKNLALEHNFYQFIARLLRGLTVYVKVQQFYLIFNLI